MPLFISDEQLQAIAEAARKGGYQAGFSDGQREGAATAQAELLQALIQFRVFFEVELGRRDYLPHPTDLPDLLEQLYNILRDAKSRWECAERRFESYQREHNPETWQTLQADLKDRQLMVDALQEELDSVNKQLVGAQARTAQLERKNRELERVIAGPAEHPGPGK